MKRLPQTKTPRRRPMPPACIIREDGEEYCVYPLDDLMSVLGRRWSLFIISVLGNRVTTRFNELLRQLEGISPRTLADRLRELDSLRLVSRTAYAEVPLRVEYSLTDDGRRMRKALIPFLKWSIDLERNRTIA